VTTKLVAAVLMGVGTLAFAQTTELTLADGSSVTVSTDKNGTVITQPRGAKGDVRTATRQTDHAKALGEARAQLAKGNNAVTKEVRQ
jgi:hypothetical protein